MIFSPWHRKWHPAFPSNSQDYCRITASCGADLTGMMEKWDNMPLLITQTLLINTRFKSIKHLQIKTLDYINFQHTLKKKQIKQQKNKPHNELRLCHKQISNFSCICSWQQAYSSEKKYLFLLHIRLVDIIYQKLYFYHFIIHF